MNGNTLINRFTYHPPKESQIRTYENIRSSALHLAEWMCNNSPESQELSLAITKLEEAVMWFNAGVARNS